MPSSTRMPPRTLPCRCRVRDDCRKDHGRKRHVAGTSERDSRLRHVLALAIAALTPGVAMSGIEKMPHDKVWTLHATLLWAMGYRRCAELDTPSSKISQPSQFARSGPVSSLQ
jgi:hypothetical protein